MSIIEQYFLGLIDEKLDRGVRALSWFLACLYVLVVRWLHSDEISVTTAIEASAVVGVVRASYILWVRYGSKSHRLNRLHDLISRCKTLAQEGGENETGFLVSMLILRDELAKLNLGLPTTGLSAALSSLQSYALEKRWDMASNIFHVDLYEYAPPDRLETIAAILGREETDLAAERQWIRELKKYEKHRARSQRYRFAVAVTVMMWTVGVAVAVVVVTSGEAIVTDDIAMPLVMPLLATMSAFFAGLTYRWLRRPRLGLRPRGLTQAEETKDEED